MALLGERAQELGGGLLARMRRVGMLPDDRTKILLSLLDSSSGEHHNTSLQIDEKGRLLTTSGSVSEVATVVAYGATRNLSNEQDTRFKDESREVRRTISVFKPLAQLATVEALVSGWRKNRTVLALFSGLIAEVFGIDLAIFTTPTIPAPNSEDTESVRFIVNGKDRVGALDLPDGFRSSAAWLADLCATWSETHPEKAGSPSHSEIEAIVLIDEIDLHLHPGLQRELVPRLRKALPKVQWFVTTHSPLVLANFDANEIVALDRDQEGNIRPLDRQILNFTTDEIYNWLMGTSPTGAAMEKELLDASSRRDRGRIAELMHSSPDTDAAEARKQVEEFGEILKAVKLRA